MIENKENYDCKEEILQIGEGNFHICSFFEKDADKTINDALKTLIELSA